MWGLSGSCLERPLFLLERHSLRLPLGLPLILVGICNGATNQEIADARGVSIETVKSQVVIIRERYGARSRAHLAALAVRHNHVY